MEKCEFLQLSEIAIVLFGGMILGALISFLKFYRENKKILEELDSCRNALDSYTTKYEDDGYEAY